MSKNLKLKAARAALDLTQSDLASMAVGLSNAWFTICITSLQKSSRKNKTPV